MRKWMRERAERRKKPAQPAKEGASQAPLQPAYFEAEAPEKHAEADVTEPVPMAQEPAEPSGEPAPAARAAKKKPARRRRRKKSVRESDGQEASSTSETADEESPAAELPDEPEESASAPVAEVSSEAVPEPPPAIAAPTEKAAAAEPQTGSARRPRGVVVLAIGLPGSGKSSWFKRHNIHPLSSDLLRQLLFDDPTEQRYQDLVFSNLRSMLKARLIARRPLNYVDATNLTPHDRHSWIRLAKDYGYEVQGVYFDVPVDTCIQRNQRRHRQVSDEVMRRMANKLKAPTFEEGFSKITVVRVKHSAPE